MQLHSDYGWLEDPFYSVLTPLELLQVFGMLTRAAHSVRRLHSLRELPESGYRLYLDLDGEANEAYLTLASKVSSTSDSGEFCMRATDITMPPKPPFKAMRLD